MEYSVTNIYMNNWYKTAKFISYDSHPLDYADIGQQTGSLKHQFSSPSTQIQDKYLWVYADRLYVKKSNYKDDIHNHIYQQNQDIDFNTQVVYQGRIERKDGRLITSFLHMFPKKLQDNNRKIYQQKIIQQLHNWAIKNFNEDITIYQTYIYPKPELKNKGFSQITNNH